MRRSITLAALVLAACSGGVTTGSAAATSQPTENETASEPVPEECRNAPPALTAYDAIADGVP